MSESTNTSAVDQVSALLSGQGKPPEGERKPRAVKRAEDSQGEPEPDTRPRIRAEREPAAPVLEPDTEDDGPAEPEDEEDDAPDTEAPESDRDEFAGEPLRLQDLAEETGVTVKDLYGVMIDMGPKDPEDESAGRETMTIGELKDAAKDVKKMRARFTEFDTERQAYELDRAMVERDFVELAGGLEQATGVRLTPQVWEALKARQSERRAVEERKLLGLVPAWRDPATRLSESGQVKKYLMQRYGFSADELSTVADSRVVTMLRDFALSALRADAASKKAKTPPKDMRSARQVTARSVLKGRSSTQPSGTRRDQAAAVAKILKG